LDLENDDGGEQMQEGWTRFATSKTRLAVETYLDEDDIGVTHTATMLVANKCDAPDAEGRWEFFKETMPFELPTLIVSAETGEGLERLRDAIYAAMDSIRVYTKHPKAKEPDRDRPFSLKRGSTLTDLAAMVHRDLAERLKFGKVWGAHVHDGTVVKPDYVLHEGDVIELHAD
ncbi:MAG TPA: TGS domain-containing protein, partial [Pirellulaceae bacterium]|nr:TGS domain-containing protein [Pirellulaceae bacterium]